VYEIDYSDYDDQETESSQASGNLEKLNKSLANGGESAKMEPMEMNGKPYIKEHYMSNSDNELDEIDYRYHSKSNDKSLKINQVIEDYKMEVGTIHHRQHHEPHQLNNSKAKQITAAKLNQSTNPIIKNYLKAKEQELGTMTDFNNHRVSISTSNKKLNDLSKKSKNLRDMTKPKISNSLSYSTVKTAPIKPIISGGSAATKKPKSPSTTLYARQDSNLDEFQIEKVVSWMTVNEENFSEFEFSIATQVNESKSSREKEKSNEHDSTYQEIQDIIKEIEHDRKDCDDFKSLQTDVEFKLNTILNSIESPDDDASPTNECNDGSSTKLK
jgi:hypothetical protein